MRKGADFGEIARGVSTCALTKGEDGALGWVSTPQAAAALAASDDDGDGGGGAIDVLYPSDAALPAAAREELMRAHRLKPGDVVKVGSRLALVRGHERTSERARARAARGERKNEAATAVEEMRQRRRSFAVTTTFF